VLAVEIDGDGAHPAAWRRAAHAPDHLLTPRRLRDVAAIAENAGFALATVDRNAATSAPPGGLADTFARFVRHGAVDGFNISPYLIPDGLDDIVHRLVPELQERGVYRTAYEGTTLREHLGLRAPAARRQRVIA
jgi:alkanesulfonate monooxygenase SsuD/methylene tetrahydromethanopterin reductase-like flavin-dependent oxidoreductase (luciferase family)